MSKGRPSQSRACGMLIPCWLGAEGGGQLFTWKTHKSCDTHTDTQRHYTHALVHALLGRVLALVATHL